MSSGGSATTGGSAGVPDPPSAAGPDPAEFDLGEIALEFPTFIWSAQQPLCRVHRSQYEPIHFATDGDGRFDPPQAGLGWGTCYFSTHPRGAFVEVFGRAKTILQSDIDDRVMTRVYLPSDLRLANFIHPRIVGRFGITNELSAGNPTLTYPISHRWALVLQQLGFSGVLYLPRHDVEGVTRSVALFGKPSGDTLDFSYESEPLDTIASEMIEHYNFSVVDGRAL